MNTYIFKVVIEPDGERWHAYCPILESYGAVTWGYTQEEALKNIREVVEMVVKELKEDNLPIPKEPQEVVEVFHEPRTIVTL